MYDRYYQSKKKAAHEIYNERPLIYSPFFKEAVRLGSEGFRHLCVSTQGERSREEQVQRFMALPLGIHILETARLATIDSDDMDRQSVLQEAMALERTARTLKKIALAQKNSSAPSSQQRKQRSRKLGSRT
jgi:hypothetical protein